MPDITIPDTQPSESRGPSSAIDLLGRSVATLLFDSGWIYRRKDTAELLDDAWVRRSTSVDIAIPRELEPVGPTGSGRQALYLVPVTILPKLPPNLMRFDFVGGSARLTLPTRRQNGLAAWAALVWATSQALQCSAAGVPRALKEELLFVALAPPEYAGRVAFFLRAPGRFGAPVLPEVDDLPTVEAAEEELSLWWMTLSGTESVIQVHAVGNEPAIDLPALRKRMAEHELLSWLLRKFGENSPILAHLVRDPTGVQRIALAYDEPIFQRPNSIGQKYAAEAGWAPYPLGIQTSYVGASSYHFEFLAPDGLDVVDSMLVELGPEAENPDFLPLEDTETLAIGNDGSTRDAHDGFAPEPVPSRGSRIHQYLDNAGTVDGLAAQVYLRVSRDRFINGAVWTSFAVAVTLGLCAVFARPLVQNAPDAEVLLLAIPGVLATVVAQAPGHPLIARMLRRARRSVLWSGVLAYVGAGVLTVIHTGPDAKANWPLYTLYGALAAAAAWQWAKLWLARKLPRPTSDEGSAEWLVGNITRWKQMTGLRRAQWRQRSVRNQPLSCSIRLPSAG